MKVPFLCFAVVVAGLYGMEWNKTRVVDQNTSRVIRTDIFKVDRPADRKNKRQQVVTLKVRPHRL